MLHKVFSFILLRLRSCEEMLIKKQEYLEKKIQEELVIIKKNGMKNKRVALQALKRKKRIEKQLEQIDGQFDLDCCHV
jgi:charged multivesicular body protein 4b